MTVRELIEKLSKIPKDKEVVIAPVDFVECDIERVNLWNDKVYLSDF